MTSTKNTNGYKIVKCNKCKKSHYIITNPHIKNEKILPCELVESMTLKQAIERAKELPSAKKSANIYNHNLKFSY